jgi:hypothetical protein
MREFERVYGGVRHSAFPRKLFETKRRTKLGAAQDIAWTDCTQEEQEKGEKQTKKNK